MLRAAPARISMIVLDENVERVYFSVLAGVRPVPSHQQGRQSELVTQRHRTLPDLGPRSPVRRLDPNNSVCEIRPNVIPGLRRQVRFAREPHARDLAEFFEHPFSVEISGVLIEGDGVVFLGGILIPCRPIRFRQTIEGV